MPLAHKQRLGRFEIHSLLGAGGMGEVYLAEDTQLRRNVAIKVLPAEFVDSKDRLERFESEAFAASSLNHPNILTIHEIGESDGSYFIATEFIDGESLRDRMAAGNLELHEILEIGVQAASALAAAHAAGIVHRDIKPENIMLRRDGIVKVLDFGLAKLAKSKSDSPVSSELPTRQNTAPGVIMGTAAYMSPEQTRGKGVDARTDIWSLGVVLYELATGQQPFRGDNTADIIGLILHKEPVQLSAFDDLVPAELDRIVHKALAKDKEDRYQVVKDLGIDLKSLKRSIEFESALERTGSPQLSTRERIANTAAISAQFSDSQIHSTSSAEYIATGIMRHKFGFAAAAIVLVALLAGFGYYFYPRTTATSIGSIAVLPFVNAGGDPNAEYLSDGITESLINNLSQLKELKVIARSSAFKFKGKDIDLDEVARALGVQAVVTGRVVQRGDQLQISAELVRVSDKSQIWGETFNRRAAEATSIEADISQNIASRLKQKLTSAEQQQLAKAGAVNPQAHDLVLRGRYHVNSWTKKEDLQKAIGYFEQAIAIDRGYAVAWADLAAGHIALLQNSFVEPKVARPKAEAAAKKALEVDDNLAEAHLALANLHFTAWEWAEGEAEISKAIELNPNLAVAHNVYSIYLSIFTRHDQSLAEIRRAKELDPSNVGRDANIGRSLFFARRYAEAIDQLKKTLELNPNFPYTHIILGYTYAANGQYDLAVLEYEETSRLMGAEDPSLLCFKGASLARAGRREDAEAIRRKLETTKNYVSPAEFAIFYVGLNEKEKAFELLERAFQERDLQLQYLASDPSYDDLRPDPRFADLLRRVGLPVR